MTLPKDGLMWALIAAGVVGVAVLICNLIPHPQPHNYQADTLETTREFHAQETARLRHEADSLRDRALQSQSAALLAQGRQQQAETRLAGKVHEVAIAKAALIGVGTVDDSLRVALVIIAAQDSALLVAQSALSEGKAAFSRLTEGFTAAMARGDSLERLHTVTAERLGLAERALAVEQTRHGCEINLIVKRIGCPSRGAVAVGAAVLGVVGTIFVKGRTG